MEMDEGRYICRTVADLIEVLSTLPPDTLPRSHEPPWTGVMVIPHPDKGTVGIHSLWSTAEGRAERAAEKLNRKAA